jgi:hypothetical protein
MAENDELGLPYPCPLCRGGPLKNMGPVPIPELLDGGKITSIIATMLYVCDDCDYMVFIYERRGKI